MVQSLLLQSLATMGACFSSHTEEAEQKKRSQMIDRKLEEDSRRFHRECKILLLGTSAHAGLCESKSKGIRADG